MKLDRTHPHAAYRVVTLLALSIAGPMGNAVAQAPAKKVPSGDPCSVVPLADVQKAFLGTKLGVCSTRVEKYGLTECERKGGGAVVEFGVQEFYGKDSAKVEAQGMAIGFVVPLRDNAQPANPSYEIRTLGKYSPSFRHWTWPGPLGLRRRVLAPPCARDWQRGRQYRPLCRV